MTLAYGGDGHGDSDNPIRWTTVGNYSSTPIVPSEVYSKDFRKIDKELGNHVYLICTKPKLSLENFREAKNGSNSFVIDIVRKKTKQNRGKRRPVTLPKDLFGMHEPNLDELGSLVEGPQGKGRRMNAAQLVREYAFWCSRQESISSDKNLNKLIKEFAALQVVYVGQAYGNGGSRTTLERLGEGHKTFTKILTEIHDYDTDLQTYIILIDCHVKRQEMRFSTNASNVAEIAARSFNLMTDDFESDKTLDVVVNAVEASLIRYFQPRRNTLLKEFPYAGSEKLKSELMSRGMEMLGVQLDVRKSCVLIKDRNDSLQSVISVYYDLGTGGETVPPSVLSDPHVIVDADALTSVSGASDPESEKFIPEH